MRTFISQSDSQLQKKANDIKSDATRRLQLASDFTEKFIREMANLTQKKMQDIEPLSSYSENHEKLMKDLTIAAHQMTFNTIRQKENIQEYPAIFFIKISISFAFSFTYIWRVVNWSTSSGFINANKKIRGDFFDISYLAISSLTDGILTKDKWLQPCRNDLISIFTHH